jgi:DNA-binding NarL/FixJ family response regulator
MAMTSTHQHDGTSGDAASPTGVAAQLTPTQIKVLAGVHSGLLNKQIAYDLGIAEATVKAHMTALMRKLNVRNRTQVAIIARSMTTNARGIAH